MWNVKFIIIIIIIIIIISISISISISIIWIIRLDRIICLSCENGHYNRTWQNNLLEEKLEGLYENKVTESRLYRDEKLGHFTKCK